MNIKIMACVESASGAEIGIEINQEDLERLVRQKAAQAKITPCREAGGAQYKERLVAVYTHG